MNARFLFNASAFVEIMTGLALLIAPELVVRLLLGDGLGQTGVAVARILGVGLLSVGVAVREAPQQTIRVTTRSAICIFNVGAAALLSIFGLVGELGGPLLWPTAVFHGLIGAAMLWIIVAPSQVASNQ